MQTVSVMTIFNANVRRVLQDRGLTIQDLAKSLGMHRETLSKILNGRVDTSMGNGQRIADALGVEFSELVRPAEKQSA